MKSAVTKSDRETMRVLVACEFSGVVRRAFRERGHDAISCDLERADDDSIAEHYRGDVRPLLNDKWDLMIAHPPCTYFCNSGVKWLYKGGRKENGKDIVRWYALADAIKFWALLRDANISRIAIENPIPHRYAREIIGSPTQIIQPWQFGHDETKATCFWLKGLPPLRPTRIVEGRQPRVHHASPGPERWKERSRTLPGIAAAMAEQWSIML